MKVDLCKIAGDGYRAVFEDNQGKQVWLKITEEEAEILIENLDITVIDIPF
mgnify:CR=1 FL=1